jgi:hypothetical protein
MAQSYGSNWKPLSHSNRFYNLIIFIGVLVEYLLKLNYVLLLCFYVPMCLILSPHSKIAT